jgi:hypothetical protein
MSKILHWHIKNEASRHVFVKAMQLVEPFFLWWQQVFGNYYNPVIILW